MIIHLYKNTPSNYLSVIEVFQRILKNVAGEIRTHDLRFRRPLLYPAEPLRHNLENYIQVFD